MCIYIYIYVYTPHRARAPGPAGHPAGKRCTAVGRLSCVFCGFPVMQHALPEFHGNFI